MGNFLGMTRHAMYYSSGMVSMDWSPLLVKKYLQWVLLEVVTGYPFAHAREAGFCPLFDAPLPGLRRKWNGSKYDP
ncbi:hypothetical protein VNO77_22866 [Canavalia gladiata]|uniref:Uncharacterized protein n=1 Tax=Canavalia gladiata TaxID=3824 RepID=A0AAN9L5Z2_CANGL